MPLADDQRALLQLLLERGQTYADLGSLLDADETQVRERARAALAELAEADPDRHVGLTDWLLGQADPIGRADAVRHLKQDAGDHELASELLAKLRVVSPSAELPKLPPPPHGRRPEAPPPTGPAPGHPRRGLGVSLSRAQARLVAALGAGAIVLIAVVLAVTGAFGGDDGESATTTTTTAAGDQELVTVPLRPQGGDGGSGSAQIGLANGDVPFVDLNVSGVPDPADDEVYVLWFLPDQEEGFPVPSPIPVRDGEFNDRLSLPSEVLPFVGSARFIDLGIVNARQLRREINAAVEGGQGALSYTGESVLRGRVPGDGGGGGGSADGG